MIGERRYKFHGRLGPPPWYVALDVFSGLERSSGSKGRNAETGSEGGRKERFSAERGGLGIALRPYSFPRRVFLGVGIVDLAKKTSELQRALRGIGVQGLIDLDVGAWFQPALTTINKQIPDMMGKSVALLKE